MKRISVTAACIVIVGVIGTAFASASYAHPPESRAKGPPLAAGLDGSPTTSTYVSPLLAKEMAVLTSKGVSAARAGLAIDVQSSLARTDLVGNAEAAMGGAFGGAWFDPVAAQLHIGVTSPASRLKAEGIVARAGLEANVALTSVRSTWAQLLAAQNDWDRKLARLFRRGQAQTALDPERNAVIIRLNAAVPTPERAVLERDASTADVHVVVAVAPSSRFDTTPMAETKCNKFVTFEAYCEPSITSGVTIERPTKISAIGKGQSNKTTTLKGFKEETLAKVVVGDKVSGEGIPAETVVYAKTATTRGFSADIYGEYPRSDPPRADCPARLTRYSPAMSEQAATPDLVGLTRRMLDAKA